jgi:signal transduction histidine kinase
MESQLEACPPEFLNYYEIVHRNTMRLGTLTEDLLNQQRIASGKFFIHKEESDICEIIETAITDVSPLLINKGINIERHYEENIPHILADPIRITQIIVNLLDNAAKFSPDKSTIYLKLEKIDDNIKISVRDEGLGLRPEDITKLFKPFPGIEKPNNFVGTGLGLSICKGIVELHNGTITVSSEGINKGSSFSFTLPLN